MYKIMLFILFFLKKLHLILFPILSKIIFYLYDWLSLRFIWWKFRPPLEKDLKINSSKGVREPSSLFLWLLSIYIAYYGLAATRYEQIVGNLEARANTVLTMLPTSAKKSALAQIALIQNSRSPIEPILTQPKATILSLFKDTVNRDVILSLKLAVEAWKDTFNMIKIDSIDLCEIDLSNTIFKKTDFKNSNLNHTIFDSANFSESQFTNTSFIGSRITATFIGCNFLYSKFDSANLSSIYLDYSKIDNSSYLNSNLSGSKIRFSKLSNCSFRMANLGNAQIEDCFINGCDFSGANLTSKIYRTVFINCRFDKKSFYRTKIENVTFINNTYFHFKNDNSVRIPASYSHFEEPYFDIVNIPTTSKLECLKMYRLSLLKHFTAGVIFFGPFRTPEYIVPTIEILKYFKFDWDKTMFIKDITSLEKEYKTLEKEYKTSFKETITFTKDDVMIKIPDIHNLIDNSVLNDNKIFMKIGTHQKIGSFVNPKVDLYIGCLKEPVDGNALFFGFKKVNNRINSDQINMQNYQRATK